MIPRRVVLAGAAGAALAAPWSARGQGAQVLRMVPQANLASLDPIWSTANITRNHGFMIYDTLYGMTAALQPTPQMAAGHVIEEDGRRVTITLRDGLAFHDGAPVRAQDVAPSLRRWMARNPFGQKLATVVDEVAVVDDKRVVFRLRKPFPLLFHALASISQAAFIMPERVAATDPFKQIEDVTGSGPFRFKRDEFNSGSRIVYERNAAYRPAAGKPSLTSGGKVVGLRPGGVADHPGCGDGVGRVAAGGDRLVRAAAAGAAGDAEAEPGDQHRGDRSVAADGDPAVEPSASAVRQQGAAAGVAAGDHPGGLS